MAATGLRWRPPYTRDHPATSVELYAKLLLRKGICRMFQRRVCTKTTPCPHADYYPRKITRTGMEERAESMSKCYEYVQYDPSGL